MMPSIFALVAAVMLAALLVTGVVLVVRSRRAAMGYPSCGGCRYDVTGSLGTTDRCPECGAAFVEVGIMPPKGRRDPMLLGAGIVLVAIVVGVSGIATTSMLVHRAQKARAQAMRQQALIQIQRANQALQQQQPRAASLLQPPADLEDGDGDEQADDGEQDGGG